MKKNRSLWTSDLLKKVKSSYAGAMLKPGLLLLISVLSISMSYAQTRAVTGKVTDNQNAPLPGVNVVVKGTLNGTVSDIDGNYRLDVVANDVLTFSFIGFETQEIPVGTQSVINIALNPIISDIDEVIVVGYGVKKKSLVTGAISSVKADELKTASVSRVDQAIQGKTAGIMILPQSGAPGSTTNIRIRGVGSNQGANPIYIVNGMRVNDLNSINPSDIESIEILKDAASAAIYGAEGANGVVLISLKSGDSSKSQVNYDFQYGIQKLRTNMEMMDAAQYKQWQSEAGQPIQDRFGADTDWMDELFNDASMQQHHISFTGGTDKTSYLISGGYLTQDGLIGGSKSQYDRYTALINVKSDVKSWLEVGGNINYMHSSANGITQNSEYNSVAGGAMIMDPLTPVVYEGTPAHVQTLIDAGNTMVKNDDGKYYAIGENITGEMANPLMVLQTTHNNTKIDQMTATGYVTLKPIKGLSFTSRIGSDFSFSLNHLWVPKFYASAEAQNSSSYVRDILQKNTRWVWDNFATYTKEIEDHSFTAMLGYSAQEASLPNTLANSGLTQFNTLVATSGPMIVEGDDFAHQGGTTDVTTQRTAGYNRMSTMASVFGRLSYDFKGKYLFEGSVRRDGASEFPADAKYGVFPALSAGWVISNEDFLKVDFLSFLKLRASWGENGSRSNLVGNEEKELWNLLARYPDANESFVSGGWQTKLPNKDLRWETSVQTDLGFDARFLNDKLSFTFDYFARETKDLISQGTFPSSTGNGSPMVNIGSVSNKGAEFELGYRNNDNAFKYGANFNVSFISNEVTELAAITPVNGTNVRNRTLTRFELNEPIWVFRGYKTDGVLKDVAAANTYNADYGTSFAPGDLRVVDANNDGQITSSDITNIGDPNPDMMFGGNLFMNYMNFDFSLAFQGTYGNDIYMAWFREDRTGSNKPAYFFEDRWTPTNTSASMPKPNNTSLYLYNGDKMIGDGSYLRIKQLQLGYTLPNTMMTQVGLNSFRVYVSLDDMFTLTNYKGMDPEVGSNVNSLQGVDRGRYPNAGRVMFGLSVNF